MAKRRRRRSSRRRAAWLLGGFGAAALTLALLWKCTPFKDVLSPEALTAFLEPYRTSWLGLPLTLAVFLLLEAVFFPVLLLILATGLIFGPWLGSLYALAGCMATAALGFWAGRRLGKERLEAWGGESARRVSAKLGRRGLLAVFIARKIPAPYMLVNLVAGASKVRFSDYMLGTLLGMGTGAVLIAVLGWQVMGLMRNPTAGGLALAAGALVVPGLLAWGLQAWLRRRTATA